MAAERGNHYVQTVKLVNVLLSPGSSGKTSLSLLPGSYLSPSPTPIPTSLLGAVDELAWTEGWGHFNAGDGVSLIFSPFQQVTLSPSLFNPEEFMPLDPTQEPIFPPELLVGDAPWRPAESH